jgi:hypothetical protein
MKRGVYLAVVGVLVLCAVNVTTVGAQVYPVRLDEQEPQPAAATPPSLVLADGGLEFPDGTVQATAAGGGAPAPVPRTGQSAVFAAGDDGDLQLGVTWPNPRFTDNGNGTVTDNLTDLIWLDDANCFGEQTWANALSKAADLSDGCSDCGGTNMDCGLADGSIAGQWRLPNLRELQSLVHYGVSSPAVPNTAGTGQWVEGDPFSGVQSSFYWSSTTVAGLTDAAWRVFLASGSVDAGGKTNPTRVWPVRGGQ